MGLNHRFPSIMSEFRVGRAGLLPLPAMVVAGMGCKTNPGGFMNFDDFIRKHKDDLYFLEEKIYKLDQEINELISLFEEKHHLEYILTDLSYIIGGLKHTCRDVHTELEPFVKQIKKDLKFDLE